MRLLGRGKVTDFVPCGDEVLLEVGDQVYSVHENEFFCLDCDGTGCKSCEFVGTALK